MCYHLSEVNELVLFNAQSLSKTELESLLEKVLKSKSAQDL